MRILTVTCLLLLMLAPAGFSEPAGRAVHELAPGNAWRWDRPPREATRADTVWFGGNDPARPGYALEGGVWDWETGGGEDPLQGWTSRDLTENEATWFGRVTVADFPPEDPCVPMFPGETGQLWCGMHEADALARDWVGGMGYGHDWCQQARSPRHDYTGGDIDLAFTYFLYTESGFDQLFVCVNCYDGTDAYLGQVELDALSGEAGSHLAPLPFAATLPAAEIPATTAAIEVELRFDSDGGKDDEDGADGFDSPCGPFAADEIALTVGAAPTVTYDFEVDAEGWEFATCPGVGSYMDVWPEPVWSDWLEAAGVACQCWLEGNALGFVSDIGAALPGIRAGQHEYGISGIVDRTATAYQGSAWNRVVVSSDSYYYFPAAVCTYYRPGYSYYPYTTPMNPDPHWSPRCGQAVYWYESPDPACHNDRLIGLSTTDNPLPPEWEQMKYIYEIICDGSVFGHDPTYCWANGETQGSPLLDNTKIGISGAADAPPVCLEVGHLFHDCFGMRYPDHVDPGDVGNSDICSNLADYYWDNDWRADSAVVAGPWPLAPEERWLCELMIKVDQKGPRQGMIPGYAAWKARLTGDVESEFVPVLMDSVPGLFGARPDKFGTYFHETHPGFDQSADDYTPAQEILPDSVFCPGTRINYYYRSYWYNDGAPPTEYFFYPGEDAWWEFEILPMMRESATDAYEVEWPCVLYIDAYDGYGAEYYIVPALDALGVDADKYDYQGTRGCCFTPLRRSYGGTHYNPGGWGNGGLTLEQLLGYRLVLVNTGCFRDGLAWSDIPFLQEWLDASAGGIGDIPRGLVLNGDEMASAIGHPMHGFDPTFLHDYLGAEWVDAGSYRSYNDDWAYCVYLEPASGGEFAPAPPGVGLYGNGCPNVFNFQVMAAAPDVPEAVGNLSYWSYGGTGMLPYVDYAQVVREHRVPGTANWRTVIDGFSLHHLSERDCGGSPCSSDSACIVAGIYDLLGPEIDWLAGGELFTPWHFQCATTAVEEESETHLAGRVSYLYPVRPNPLRSTAAVRFCLEAEQEAEVTVYDVTGRQMTTLVSGACPAGETTVVWDGRDDRGRPVGPGIYWVQLRTPGYCSSKRLVTLE